MNEKPKLYPEVDPRRLPTYLAHVAAMTEEGLDSKGAIAEQLAYRDSQLADVLAALRRLTTWCRDNYLYDKGLPDAVHEAEELWNGHSLGANGDAHKSASLRRAEAAESQLADVIAKLEAAGELVSQWKDVANWLLRCGWYLPQFVRDRINNLKPAPEGAKPAEDWSKVEHGPFHDESASPPPPARAEPWAPAVGDMVVVTTDSKATALEVVETGIPGDYSVKVRKVVGYCETYAPTDLKLANPQPPVAPGTPLTVEAFRAELIAAFRTPHRYDPENGWSADPTLEKVADELERAQKGGGK